MGFDWQDRWRRYGPMGFLAKVALRPAERLVGLDLQWLLRAPIASVEARLQPSTREDAWRLEPIALPDNADAWRDRLAAINPGLDLASLTQMTGVVVATDGETLGGYWCYSARGDDLYERGVFVSPAHRGAGLGSRLLAAMVAAHPAKSGTLHATVETTNRASLAMLRKAGLGIAGLVTSAHLPALGDVRFVWERPS